MIEEETSKGTPERANRFAPAVLDSWGVDELRTYIAALQAEIARAEATIAKRESHRGAADALFRRP